jgi:hypothetical protein
MFLKGTVKGSYLLTMANDSEKDSRGVLFRDIQPDAFYPVYGDASIKTFDAQTSGRFYLRAERGRSYVVYGDLQTATLSADAQNLGTYSRSLTGVQQHFENGAVMLNLFASRDTLRQVIDEFAGRGLSGPYTVSNANGVWGTEKVEIVTRDRNQPAVILSTTRLSRFADYDFEPFSGRILFRRPVPSMDERLNPISVRVTYEVDRGGERAWVGGVDGQVAVGRNVRLGGSWAEDGTEGATYRLRSVNGTVRLGGSTTLVAEAAQSTGDVNTNGLNATAWTNLAAAQGEVDGTAARVELRHASGRVAARAFAGTSEPGFNNAASAFTGGRTEAGGRATVTVANGMRVVGEALRSEDRLTGGHREGGQVALEATLARRVALEVGVRRATETGSPAQGTSAGLRPFDLGGPAGAFGFTSIGSRVNPVTGLPLDAGFAPTLSAGAQPSRTPQGFDLTTVRARMSASLGRSVSVYGEAEQDVRDADKRLAAVGGAFNATDRSRVYVRHEFLSSLGGPYALTDGQRSYNTVFGVSSSYVKQADVFSEYRMRDAISSREAEAAIGLRNLWPVAEGLRLSTSVERLHAIAATDETATAASLGVEYTRSALAKSTGRIEWRRDRLADTWLSTLGFARKLSRDWTLLSKNYFQLTAPIALPDQTQNRFWLGGAYRDTDRNRVNLLSRYEFRLGDTLDTAADVTSRRMHGVSTHVDVHPARAWRFSGQHAAKWVHEVTAPGVSRTWAQLWSARAGYDLSSRVDLGALASVRWSSDADPRVYAVGGEVGFRVRDNVWLSAGYNVSGFRDRDFETSNETARGAFVRLRMKFDENLLGR